MEFYVSVSVHEQSMKHTSLKNRPRCYVRSPAVQDAFQPISGLISCSGVTRRWGLLSHAQNAVRWLVLSKRSVEALQRHHLFVHLSFVQLSFMQLSFVQLSFVQLSFVQLSFVQLSFVQLSFVQLSFVQLSFVQLSFMQLSFVQLSFVRRA